MIASRIIPLLLIIGAIGLFVGYTQSTYSGSVTALKEEIASLDSALDAAEQFRLKEAQLTQQRNAMSSEQLERLESFLPDSVDNVQLIVDLNSLASRSGIQLSEFSIQGGNETETTGRNTSAVGAPTAAPLTTATAPAQGTTLALQSADSTESLELSVSATGSYAAFRTFLAGVEQSLRPLDVVELSVDDSNTGVYTYDVTFRLYWLR